MLMMTTMTSTVDGISDSDIYQVIIHNTLQIDYYVRVWRRVQVSPIVAFSNMDFA